MSATATFDTSKLGEDVMRVAIGGRLDVTSAPVIRGQLSSLVDASAEKTMRVVVELADLKWIDSSGVGALVSLYKRVRLGGGDVKVAGLSGQPKEIFRLLRLEAAFEVFDSVEEAASRLRTA